MSGASVGNSYSNGNGNSTYNGPDGEPYQPNHWWHLV